MNNEYKCNETIYYEDIRFNGTRCSSSTGCNITDEDSLEYHRQFDASIFSPILGYVEKYDGSQVRIDGEEFDDSLLNEDIFMVVRGHHRAEVACEQGINIPCHCM